MNKYSIVTRGSDLAQYQTESVVKHFAKFGFPTSTRVISTRGDRDYRPLKELKGDGFFTKELEYEILKGEATLAVHSAKDLPSVTHKGLPWKAILERENSNDIIVINRSCLFSESPLKIKQKTRIGTSSPRRIAQLNESFYGIEVVDLRGNVPTRLKKVLNGDLDAVVLAGAGLRRLNLLGTIPKEKFAVVELDWVTAPCQGVLALQYLSSLDLSKEGLVNSKLTDISHAEKSFLSFLGGGCHLALGASISELEEGGYSLRFFNSDEGRTIKFELSAANLSQLKQKGFEKILGSPDSKPRIWLTNPLPHQMRIGKTLIELGYTPIHFPLINIAPSFSYDECERIMLRLHKYSAVVFTSRFGAKFFLQEIGARSWEALESLRLYAIGESTASVLRSEGLKVKVAKSATAVEFTQELIKEVQGRILLPTTRDSILMKELSKHSVDVDALELYTASPEDHFHLPSTLRDDDCIAFSSPSAVSAYKEMTSRFPELIKASKLALGPTTEAALRDIGETSVISSPTPGDWKQLVNAYRNS